MNNRICLGAQIKDLGTVRYTPAGLPVLALWLSHESWQEELGERYLAKIEIEAKALGEIALNWQYQVGDCVEISGFLAQKGLNHNRPVLHIQSIHENKD